MINNKADSVLDVETLKKKISTKMMNLIDMLRKKPDDDDN
jgi:hypothetical protein